MATKKEVIEQEVIEQEVTEQEVTEQSTSEATTEDKKKDWPTIFIPKKGKDDDQRVFSVNFRHYIVQTNKQVKVPPELYEVYQNSLESEEFRDSYETSAATD